MSFVNVTKIKTSKSEENKLRVTQESDSVFSINSFLKDFYVIHDVNVGIHLQK